MRLVLVDANHIQKLLTMKLVQGAIPTIWINPNRRLSNKRRLVILKKILKTIHSGLNLKLEDSNETGNKFTHCNWGLCTSDAYIWDDPEDHTFPVEFVINGRIDPIEHGHCPLDKRDPTGPRDGNGCFWSCRAFKEKLTREQVVELYEKEIARMEALQ